MGEIGFDRNTVLYDLEWWEFHLIIKGYRKRDALKLQLLRIVGYSAYFSFRENKQQLGPEEWLRIPALDDEEQKKRMPTEDEVNELQELMRNINKRGDQ